MKAFGILSIILGIIGVIIGGMMFGDIGIACLVGAFAALFSGIGLIKASKKISKLEKELEILSK